MQFCKQSQERMPFPLVKLLSLGLKQGSKHVASFVKREARDHETVRKVIIKAADWYHRVFVRSQLSFLGMGKTKNVQPLTPEAALELGTEMVGDLVIILCGLGIYLVVDSRGSSKGKDSDAVKRIEEELKSLRETVSKQTVQLEEQAIKIEEVESLLKNNMFSKTSVKVIKQLNEETNKKISNIVVKR